MRGIHFELVVGAALLATISGLVAADFGKKLDNTSLRKLTGGSDQTQKTCPDNTFICYESCCTNAEECCTTTKGCVAVGECTPPSPQSIKQFDEDQR
jgi:hypothetical protein